MGQTNDIFTKVTGLTWDVESLIADGKISEETLAWLIPDGAMLDSEGVKKDDTLELLSLLGIDKEKKFSTADIEYDDEDPNNNDSSND